jgi:hypothetical protein
MGCGLAPRRLNLASHLASTPLMRKCDAPVEDLPVEVQQSMPGAHDSGRLLCFDASARPQRGGVRRTPCPALAGARRSRPIRCWVGTSATRASSRATAPSPPIPQPRRRARPGIHPASSHRSCQPLGCRCPPKGIRYRVQPACRHSSCSTHAAQATREARVRQRVRGNAQHVRPSRCLHALLAHEVHCSAPARRPLGRRGEMRETRVGSGSAAARAQRPA